MKKPNVAPATEIIVSLMSYYADSTGNHQLQNDPRTYIYKTTHINIPDEVDLSVVENSHGIVNLVLPYYDSVLHTADAVADDDLGDISGGHGDACFCAFDREVTGREETGLSYDCTACTFGMEALKRGDGFLITIA